MTGAYFLQASIGSPHTQVRLRGQSLLSKHPTESTVLSAIGTTSDSQNSDIVSEAAEHIRNRRKGICLQRPGNLLGRQAADAFRRASSLNVPSTRDCIIIIMIIRIAIRKRKGRHHERWHTKPAMPLGKHSPVPCIYMFQEASRRDVKGRTNRKGHCHCLLP